MSARRLAEALSGRGSAGTHVLRGTRPSPLDGPSLRAATTPLMAAFMVAAAVLRARMDTGVLDLMGLALRTLALTFLVRAVVDSVRLVRGLLRDRRASQYALAYDDEGLLLRGPEGDTYVARGEVAALVTPPERRPGEARLRARPLWIVRWPEATQAGRGWVAIPPYFAADSGVLHARLVRWLGEARRPSQREETDGTLPAAAGAGWVARRAPGFWKRAPWAWLLLGVACLDLLRVAPDAWRGALQFPALSMAALTLAAPVAWLLWVDRRTRTPGGLLLSLSPSHITAIARDGSVALRWEDIASVELTRRARWSPFEGGHCVATLAVRTHDGVLLRFDSSLLDAPLEVVAALCAAAADVDLDED